VYNLTVRPIRLYFDQALREQWLTDMVQEGRRKHIVSDEDAATILGSVKEPFIQKYLKSLAVHVCTLPVTQAVSGAIALWYVWSHPDMPRAQAWAVAAGIIALFQVVPISPGSLTRGLYVLYVVIRERNVKDYSIALSLGFFKYVGYLSFPIQMTYRYPALARFMAGHWATDAVHIVPVFGEQGALLERWAFDLFYNWPLTLRRRVRERMERRALLASRWWHTPVVAFGSGTSVGAASYGLWAVQSTIPELNQVGWLLATVAFAAGGLITLWAGGTKLGGRIVQAAIGGLLTGAVSSAAATLLLTSQAGVAMTPHAMVADTVWRSFIATVLAVLGAVFTELALPDPGLKAVVSKKRSEKLLPPRPQSSPR
jgi:hypothetical protein